MDLRSRTTHVFTAAGALLIVASLSLSGGVAVAVPRPAADDEQATTSSSKPKKQKSKKPTTTTTTTTEKAAKKSTSTTTGPATRPPASTATTSPRTTATTAPATPTTRGAAETAPHQVDPATEPSTDDPAADSGQGDGDGVDGDGDTGAPEPATKSPTARSGSGGRPPGIYPVGPGSRVANSTPSATSAPAPATTVTSPPVTVVPADTEPAREGSGTVSEAGVSDPVTNSLVDPSVGGAELDRGQNPVPARRSQELGQTGDGTRRLVLLGGVALLLGALVVAFTGRDRPEPQMAARPAGPARRRPRSRRELDGWEDGVPLAPAKRELARHRLGFSASGRPGDGPPGAGPGA